MTAAGKINASKVQAGDRILVKRSTVNEGVAQLSDTKTGEGVHVARVTFKEFIPAGRNQARGTYTIHTTSGISPGHMPVQTMWLAPEDAAGIKRAMAEAKLEDAAYDRTAALAEEALAQRAAAPAPVEFTTAEREELAREFETSGALDDAHHEALVEKAAREAIDQTAAWLTRHDCDRATFENVQALITVDHEEALTLHSQDGKVDNMNNASETSAPAQPTTEDHTGSTVVRLLEKVWARIRADHPELPEVVIITGSGLVGASKWGHFRAEGWKLREEGAAVRKHELFLAGEALAKGARQVLQTMLHEAAHTLAKVRGQQDTSRQGRWHNATFRKMAEELGLEHKSSTADKTNGFSFVTLTAATAERYADLLAELDEEIKLVCHLPLWLGGTADQDEEAEGGEKITGKPQGEGGAKSGPLKATCGCEEPLIIRLSQKVMDLGVVRCDDCRELFTAG